MMQERLETAEMLIRMRRAQSISIRILEEPLREPHLRDQSGRVRARLETGETPPQS